MGLAETFDPMRPARVILPSNSAGVLEFMGERLLLCADGQSARQHLSHVHDPDDEVHPRVCQSVIGPLVRRGDIGLHLRIGPLCSFKRVRIEHRFCCVQHHHIDHGLFFSVRRRGRLQGGGGAQRRLCQGKSAEMFQQRNPESDITTSMPPALPTPSRFWFKLGNRAKL